MRYYDLSLFAPITGQLLTLSAAGFSASTSGLPTFSSRVPIPPGGAGGSGGTINNPGALNIEFDIPVAPFATPQGLQSIRVWGIGLQQLASTANLNPANGQLGAGFTLVAGMKPGLPLATATAGQAGVVAQGSVFQAYGNWQGVNQTLELVVQPAVLTPSGGIKWSWQPGQLIDYSIQAALLAAFPGYTVPTPNITALLVQGQSSQNVSGHYGSLSDFAGMILEQTRALGAASLGSAYPGVNIVINGKTIYVYDYAVTGPVQLQFRDLIGQPTWIDPATVNFKAVLRADIQVGTTIQFPSGIASPYALTTATAAVPGAPSRNASTFQGTFLVQEVHQYGNFRQADADSWATAFSAVSTSSVQ